MEPIQRNTFWMISSGDKVIFYILATISMAIFFYGFYRRFRLWNSGVKERISWGDIKTNLKYFFDATIKQNKIKRDRIYGIMHRFTSYGFVILFIGTCLVAVDYDLGLHVLYGNFYLIYEAFLDIFGVLFLIGLFIAIRIRAKKKRSRLIYSLKDQAFLWLLFMIGVTGYFIEAIRIAETNISYERWSPVGYSLSLLIERIPLFDLITYPVWWFIHAIQVFILIAMIPYTKLFHLLTAPINILFQPVKRTGKISLPYQLSDLPENQLFHLTKVQGVNKISDFTKWQLLSTDACTECGRCESQCPAHLSGKPLSPRSIVIKIRDNMKPNREIASFITPEELQSCTTCGACVEACPVSINHIDLILSMRRGLIHNGIMETEVENTLLKMEEQQNPWGKPWSERTDWSKGMNIPTLDHNDENDK